MKKILSILLVMMFTVTSLVGCKSGEEQTALKINHEILSMTLFGETDLVVEGGNADELTWENSAENVVKMQPLGESARLIAVGSNAFSGCTAIKNVTVVGGDAAFGRIVFAEGNEYLIAAYGN